MGDMGIRVCAEMFIFISLISTLHAKSSRPVNTTVRRNMVES